MGTLPVNGRDRSVSGQIDRLAVTDKRVLIVDYKTNRPAADTLDQVPFAYIAQMALYRAMLQRIYPGRCAPCCNKRPRPPQRHPVPTRQSRWCPTDCGHLMKRTETRFCRYYQGHAIPTESRNPLSFGRAVWPAETRTKRCPLGCFTVRQAVAKPHSYALALFHACRARCAVCTSPLTGQRPKNNSCVRSMRWRRPTLGLTILCQR